MQSSFNQLNKHHDNPTKDSGLALEYQPASALCVTGEDALPFLQGQFTQELKSGAAMPVAYGLWLNQKGRVMGDSHILRVSPHELWLFSLGSPAAVLRERLEAYIIADDVNIDDQSAGWRGLLLAGEAAREWLVREFGAAPEPGSFVRAGDGFAFHGRRGIEDSIELLLPRSVPGLPPSFSTMEPEQAERARILAGVPAVPRDVGPGDLPNEAGLEDEAISYTKGCYLGQEVMARLKAMGRVRRRLERVVAARGSVPPVPSALFQGDKVVGELRSVVPSGKGEGWAGLAMLSLLALDGGSPLALAADAEPVLTVEKREERT